MPSPLAGSRSRARNRLGLTTEALESRRLLASTVIDVTTGVTFAPGLPVAGLATGIGLAATNQTVATVSVSVSPATTPAPAAVTPAIPSPTGPSTTLSPLMTDSETANATASEVARPTPGRSDRISNLIVAPEIVPLPHLREPEAIQIIPGPEVQPVPLAPAPAEAAPEAPKAESAVPARPADVAPVPKAEPAEPKEPMAFRAWDAAIDLVTPSDNPTASVSDSPIDRAEGALAIGALLAAWGGWKYAPKPAGRSRRRATTVAGA